MDWQSKSHDNFWQSSPSVVNLQFSKTNIKDAILTNTAPVVDECAEIFRNELGFKVWRCKVCGRDSKHKQNFINHYRLHTGEKPFACPHCSYRATQKVNLEYHLLSIHFKNSHNK